MATKQWNENLEVQRRRLLGMAAGDETWDLSENDQQACQTGADAIKLIDEFMGLPDWTEREPTDAHHAMFAAMRELLFRGQRR